MNKKEILQAIDKYFENTSPEDVVVAFEELGCEFEDIESCEISFSHLKISGEVMSADGTTSESVELSGLEIQSYVKEGFVVSSEPSKRFHSDDKTYNQLPEAA